MYLKELIGYAASVIVAISLMMSSLVKLRVLNLIGSITFSIYGFLINSLPVGFLNLFICFVNVYYLIKMYKTSEYFSILQVNKDSVYLEKFFEFYKKDISKFFPNFNYQQANYLVKENIYYFFILRDLIPAGILIVEKKENFQYIHLDYVIPAYRDLKIAMFLFVENIDYMRNLGFTNLHTHASHNLHSNYLRKIGFLKIGKDDLGEIYEKKLN